MELCGGNSNILGIMGKTGNRQEHKGINRNNQDNWMQMTTFQNQYEQLKIGNHWKQQGDNGQNWESIRTES